jgi:regulatory protein YycH of two-component signal transduction system YycFG
VLPEDTKQEIESLYKQVENHQKHYSQLEAKLETTESKLKQLSTKKQPGTDLFSPETSAIREESFALEFGTRVYLDAQEALLDKVIQDPPVDQSELLLQLNSIAIAVSANYAQIDNLFRRCQDALGMNDMPPILNSKHVLTPEEKERLEDAKLVIEHKFKLDADSREFKRAQENKRSAGRPAGSLNKNKI